jgi:hypothetical protein
VNQNFVNLTAIVILLIKIASALKIRAVVVLNSLGMRKLKFVPVINVGMDSLWIQILKYVKLNAILVMHFLNAIVINCVSKTDANVNQIMYSIISVITCHSNLVYSSFVIMTVIAINSTAKEFVKTDFVTAVN